MPKKRRVKQRSLSDQWPRDKGTSISSFFDNKADINSPTPPPRLLSVNEVAAYLGMDSKFVYEQIRTGTLRALKLGRVWRMRKGDCEAWLNRCQRR